MSLVSDSSENSAQTTTELRPNRFFSSGFTHLPRNVYLLLLFTLGKGFQLSISALTLNYYVHSLGYQPEFIGVFSAMPAIGSMISAVPVGRLSDRIGRKPVLLLTALLTPMCLALTALVSSAPLLLAFGFLQGVVSTAYWVTNLPLLVESSTEKQRVGVLAVNSFLLLGVGALGNLLGGAIPEWIAAALHLTANSTLPLRWGVFSAALFTFVFGLPLWFLKEAKRSQRDPSTGATDEKNGSSISITSTADGQEQAMLTVAEEVTSRTAGEERLPWGLFVQLLIPDLVFTMGEGAVVALIQLYFVLRFHLLPGPLGLIFTVSGLVGGIFSLTSPLFVKRWSKLRLVTTVQYLSAPLMVLIGLAPTLPLAIAGEYTRSFMRTLIDPVYAAFAMEKVSDKHRATLSGLYSVTWSIGFSIGPAVGGWLQTNISLSTSFIFGACCLLLAPTLLLLSFGRRRDSVQGH